MSIVRLHSGSAPTNDVCEVLERDGAVVLLDAVPSEVMDTAERELEPWLVRPGSASPLGNNEFGGWATLRTSGLIAKSSACRVLAMHAQVLEIADRVLGPQCARFQLSFTQAIKIDAGERAQVLHRDATMYPFQRPGPEVFLNAIWALTPFSEENGGTRLCLGSHRWPEGSRPSAAATEAAQMPKGSVLVYYGSLWHGGGENSSATPRVGIAMGYTLGWLRQEENQYLAVPPPIAATLPVALQQLLGYAEHYPFLGWYEGQDDAVFRGGAFRKQYHSEIRGGASTPIGKILAAREFVAATNGDDPER